MTKARLHTATLIIGSIIAFAISFSQFLVYPSAQEKIKTEQTGKAADSSAASYTALPSFSLPVPVSLQANLNPCCLFEIFFEEDVDENDTGEIRLHPDRFFETMFRVIISPNAP